jgi:hypothetical protein
VIGFKDFDCEVDITEEPVVDEGYLTKDVYRYVGWDEEDFDDNVICSPIYTNKTQAKNEFENAKANFAKTNWDFHHYTIGERNWIKGFHRYDPPLPDDNPDKIHLVRLLHAVEEQIPLNEEDIVLIPLLLRREEKIVRFCQWIDSKLEGEKLSTTKEEILRAVCRIDDGRSDLP